MSKDVRTRLDAIFAPYNRSDAPGCAVAVARAGTTIYRAGFGLANVEHGIANSPSTPMPIGSVTKQFTCAAALLLAAEGRLALDDPIGHWLPELPESQRSPTLRQLMTHTGGIRCYLDNAVFNGYQTVPAGGALRSQRRQRTLNFEPGHAASYSNGGYHLLSLAMERSSQMPFESLLGERIFAPLDMRSTCLARWRWPIRASVANTYLPERNGWRHGLCLSEEMLGDGAMISTVDDLLRWAAYLRTSGGPVSLGQMTVPPRLSGGGQSNYCFGLICEEWRGLRTVQHGGSLPGASCAFIMLPDQELDIAVMFNRNAPATDLGLEIAAAVLGTHFVLDDPAPRTTDHTRLLGSYLGVSTGLVFAFADVEGQLGLSLFGGPPTVLKGIRERQGCLPFSADVGTGEMRFRTPATESAVDTEIDYFDGGAWYRASPIESAAPDVRGLLATAGATFASAEWECTLRFDALDGDLVAHLRGEHGQALCHAEFLGPDMVRVWPERFSNGFLARLIRHGEVIDEIVVSTTRTRRTVFRRQRHGEAP